jgi:hypothetical protein
MKKSIILSAILFGSLVYNSAQAQISIHIGLHIPAGFTYLHRRHNLYKFMITMSLMIVTITTTCPK